MTEEDEKRNAYYEDIKIIRLCMVKQTCISCHDQEGCDGCTIEEHRKVRSYFKDEDDDVDGGVD